MLQRWLRQCNTETMLLLPEALPNPACTVTLKYSRCSKAEAFQLLRSWDRETLKIWSLNMPAVATLKLCQLFRHWNSVSCWSTKKLPVAVTRKLCLLQTNLNFLAAATLKNCRLLWHWSSCQLMWHWNSTSWCDFKAFPFSDVEDLPAEWHSPAVVSLRIASFCIAEYATCQLLWQRNT